MADLTKTAGALIAEVRDAVNKDLWAVLRPIVKKMHDAAQELERALGGAQKAKPSRLAKPVKPAPPSEKPSAAKPGRKPRAQAAPPLEQGKRTVNPRGALPAAIREALKQAPAGLRLADLRDRVLAGELFQGRDKLALYNQIAGTLKTIPDVVKNDKVYTLEPPARADKPAALRVKNAVKGPKAKLAKPA